MYPNEPTQTEIINEQIRSNSKVSNEYVIKKLIEKHDTEQMEEGIRYYFNQNDILQRRMHYWKDKKQIEDPTKTNNRIPSGWHRLLVDQKVSYVAGNPLVVSAPDTKFAEDLNLYFNQDFDDVLNELVKNASNKGVEYLHPYIDENGLFEYIIVPAQEIIPIYADKNEKKLSAVIRYYEVSVDMESDDTRTRAEYWDEKTVTYYILDDSGEFVLDMDEPVNPEPHFTYGETGYGWEKVPFIAFRNNEENVPDIKMYKAFIDAYDLIRSDAQNNLEEIQSLIHVLKGYEGTDLGEFMDNLRYYKAVKVDEDGGLDTHAAELPINTVKELMQITQDDIIAFGMGVNPKQENFGQNTSGVALQFLYSLLDLKAGQLQRKFTRALGEFTWFFTEYLSISQSKQYDPESATFTFNNAMIFNETEQITNALNSGGQPSTETALKNHPWVDNVETEMKLKKEDEQRQAEAFPSLGDIDGDV